MRIQITGSREFTDYNIIRDAIFECPWHTPYNVTVVHGDARGADRIAGNIARNAGMTEEAHPANWARYGNLAGPVRNVEMLDAGCPDVVLAFYKRGAGNAGTGNMVRECKLRGLTVREYWEE